MANINCVRTRCHHSLFLLGALATSLALLLLDDGLDHTDGDGLSHITHGEPSQWRVVSESLDDHGLGGLHGDHACISVLDELGVRLHGLTGTTIHLLVDILELGGNVRGVAIKDRSVAVLDLSGVRHDDDLSLEGLASLGRIVGRVGGDVTTLNILDGDVLAVKSDVVTGHGLGEGLVVHLHGLDFSGEAHGGEGDDHAGLQDTGLDTPDGDSADTTNLVHILQRETKRLVGGALGRVDQVKSLKKERTLVPGHVGGAIDHVVTDPAGDRDEVDLSGLVTDLLQVSGDLLLDIVVTRLRVVAGVHLVESDNHLLHTQSEGKESVLLSLSLICPATLETTRSRIDDKEGNISL